MGFCSLYLLISDIIGARARQTSSAVVNLNPGHIRSCARIDAAPYSRYYLRGDAREALDDTRRGKWLWLKILAKNCQGNGCEL